MADIKPIDQELSELLAGFAQSSTGGSPTEQVPVQESGTPAPTVEAPLTTEQPVATSIEAPKVEEAKAVVPTNQSFDDWDAEGTTSTSTVVTAPSDTVSPVLSELGKVLGIEKLSTVEDAVKMISSIKAEAEKAKNGLDKSTIRPELQKAIELDQNGGDFYEYLKVTSVDYTKQDPTQLYEDYVIDRAADAQGNVDVDKVNEYLDSLSDMEKQIRGKELQNTLVREQARKVADIERETIMKKEKHDAELRAALGTLQEIDGFKVGDKHRRESFDWITSGKMMKDMFYKQDGSFDPVKAAKVAFRNLYYEKLDAYQKQKIKNATQRETFAELTNAQITTPSIPTNATPNKSTNPIDLYIKSLEDRMINK